MGWQEKKVQLPDSRIADGVVLIDPTTGDPQANNGLTDSQLRASPVPTADATVANRLPSAFLTPGLLPVDVLGSPGVARVQATSGTAASIVLTTTCRRISMYATQGTWYSLSGTATSSSHYIAAGERLDFDVAANTTVSVLQETSAGSIRITELA